MSQSQPQFQEFVDDLRAVGGMPEELVEIFSEESEDHLHTIQDGLDRLRVDSNDLTAIGDIRRAAHTLKGAAGAVGAPATMKLAYRLETMLNLLLEQNRGASVTQVDLSLDAADTLSDLLAMEEDFDVLSQRLCDLSVAMDAEISTLQAGSDTAAADQPVAKQESPAVADADDAQAEPPVEPTVADSNSDHQPALDEAELATIRTQLTTSQDLPGELIAIFNEEAEEHLLHMYDGLDQIKSNRTNESALSSVRRSTHTLKGAAAAVGLEVVTRLTHRMEDMLDWLADNKITPSETQVELCLMTTDQVHALMSNDELDVDETVVSIGKLYGRFTIQLEELGASESPAADAPAATDVENVEFETKTEAETKVAVASDAPEAKENTESTDAGEAKSPVKPVAKTNQNQQYLRVPLERLDGLVALIGEMVVNRSAFNQRLSDFESRIEDMQTSLGRFRTVANEVETRYGVDALKSSRRAHFGGDNIVRFDGNQEGNGLDSLEFDRYSEIHLTARSLTEATNDVAVITNELKNLYGDFESLLGRQQRFNRDAQNTLMQIRMVPVSSIVNRLERTVRTVSNKIGKKVELNVVGESTELDKTVLEEIVDPLLHLVRNGLDHGIETPEERVAAGKSKTANLTLEALNQGTRVTLRVIDDGRGISLEKIRQKATEQGLISPDQNLSKSELLGLIFLPGFSTASSLTDVSGRGVGMDVVRDAVSRLKGTISVDSEMGEGSTFTIHLPTTLAMTRALMVESNGQQFALPMQAVQQITRVDTRAVSHVGSQSLIRINDRTLKLKSLALHLAMVSEDKVKFDTAAPMLIIRAGDDEVAVTIDAIHGGQDIVVKTMGDHLRSVPCYIGATLAGDGAVIPILDPVELCGQTASKAFVPNFVRSDSGASNRRRTAMVIDDSLSVRRVTTNLLRSRGWDVLDAKDGVDAIEKLAQADTPPDVFLCDMEMPRMDGLELVRRIRSQEEFEQTPVVMVTSRAGEKHRRMAAEAGADEHVVKPFNDDQLIQLITRMVSQHRELVGV